MITKFELFEKNEYQIKLEQILDELGLKYYQELGTDDDYYIVKYKDFVFEMYCTYSNCNIKIYKNSKLEYQGGVFLQNLSDYLKLWMDKK